jgi:hypothetical protein
MARYACRDSALSVPAPFFVVFFVHVHVGSWPCAFSTAVCQARLTFPICLPVSSPKT